MGRRRKAPRSTARRPSCNTAERSTERKSTMKNRLGSIVVATALSAALLGSLAGCGGAKESQGGVRYVWPELPDSPRVAYVETFRGEKDFSSGLGGLVSDLAGSEKAPLGLGRPFDVCV